jgi:hypothetical protein
VMILVDGLIVYRVAVGWLIMWIRIGDYRTTGVRGRSCCRTAHPHPDRTHGGQCRSAIEDLGQMGVGPYPDDPSHPLGLLWLSKQVIGSFQRNEAEGAAPS